MKYLSKTKMGLLFFVATALLLSLVGCATNSGVIENPVPTSQPQNTKALDEDADPFGKYEPGIVLTTVFRDEARKYPQGQTWDNNVWTKAYEEELGIQLKYLWSATAQEFDAKMNMAIATNELPEIMAVNYDQFYRMASAGMLEDLTEVYEKYASDDIKKSFEITGRIGLEMDTIDGKLFGIGESVKPGASLIFAYRNDWVENLGLEKPETVDDIINLMYAISKGDPNGDGTKAYGLPIHKEVLQKCSALTGFFNMYDAHPESWVEKDGKLEYGGIQPEMITALKQLHQMFKDGVINPEFGMLDPWGKFADDYVNNIYGVSFAPNWWTDLKGSDIAKNTNGKGTWGFIPIPSVSGGIAKTDTTASQGRVLCVRKGTKHPEAALKILNLQVKLLYADPSKYHTQVENGESIPVHFFRLINLALDWAYKDPEPLSAVARAIEARDPSGLNELDKAAYERCIKYLEGDLGEYGAYGVYGPGGSYVTFNEVNKLGGYYINPYYGPNTDTMNKKLGGLKSKMIETITKIIMQGDVEKEFNAWVDYWNSQGGAEITEEVNSWYERKK